MGTQVENEKKTFREILSHFDNAMLVTRASDGFLRSRPMAIADSESDGDLWFFTSIESGKVDEIMSDPRCAAVMQGNLRYLSISGRAELVKNQSKIDELWKPTFDAWFEDGKNDPNLTLIRFKAEEGEYWDNSGVKGLRYMLEVAKALFHGGTVNPEKLGDNHAQVRL
ncbi:pyridoxamine 5'-phosphate oxidase family protein [Haliangium ochraceum]|uniref:Pyridoxamine 5'-phosphate oxidase-related FMN-binding protein n=1 Tax=Haliangium ochraceum (strain DSM 14365 / JCM 11303 / SMP-2) TaxID=502025 RepID=D0LMI2_HALO1|nr:pyridoxamine 5'-phosphate oxidase family protein [Haliangium ochraceum]ACY18669.1 pyridoxamine 5'-phosphate oxidase-related FMN- binding protein [Haliangium ochraceum DSM 14365]